MQNAACKNEYMENRMHPFFSFAKSVKDRAYSVGNTSGNKENYSPQRHDFVSLFYEKYNCPAHCKVANHGENTVFL